MREPYKFEKSKNPFRKGVKFVLPALLGAGERSFYWILICENLDKEQKEVWVEVKQSIFLNPKYKFHPNIIKFK